MKAPVTILGQTILGSPASGLGGIPSNVSMTRTVSGKYVTLQTALNPGTIRVSVNGVWVPMTTNVPVGFPAEFTSLTVALSQALTNQIVGIYQTTGGMGAGPYVKFTLAITSDPTPGTTI